MTFIAVSPDKPNATTSTNPSLELTALICKEDISCSVNGECPTDKGTIYFGIAPKGLVITTDELHLLLLDEGKTGSANKFAEPDKPKVHLSIDLLTPDDRDNVRTLYNAALTLLIDCAKKGLHKEDPPSVIVDRQI